MSQLVIPVLFALLMWWISTGLILRLVSASPKTYPAAVIAAALVLFFSLWGLARSGQTVAADAYVTFTCVLGAWGFVELTFLTGYVTGPRISPLPQGATGWQRFRYATEAILFHELLLLAMGAAVLMAAGPDNLLAWGTYAALWVMRLSAKLNLFLGVPSLNADLLPRQLVHLASYFRRRPINWLLPLSIGGSLIAAVILFNRAVSGESTDYTSAAHALLAALVALALLEHLFMLMPFRAGALWGRAADASASTDAVPLAPAPVYAPQADAPVAHSSLTGIRSLGGLK
jgi:putative photosynthetic complex assembly protein 2